MTNLIVKNLSVSAGDTTLVHDASFALQPGELVVLLGPNGAGKTSLLRGALGLAPLQSGIAEVEGQNTATLKAQKRARKMSYLPQSRPLAWPIRVKDVVALGRFAHGAALSKLSEQDQSAVDSALNACALSHLSDRRTDTLSGGELARVHFARALAADTPLLIADEPIAALDPRHQFGIMDIIAAYVSNGNGALVVLHDIALAARYATRIIWMRDGCITADGPVEATLTEARIAKTYGIQTKVNGRTVQLLGPSRDIPEASR